MHLTPMRLRFRFHVDDHAKYGADWTVYDEAALIRLPVRQLIELESSTGMSIREMMARLRGDFLDGYLAASWIAQKLAEKAIPDFDEYEPMAVLMEWEPAPAGDADPPEQPASPSSSEA